MAASTPASNPEWTTVKTTLPARPLPVNSSRAPVTTKRLIIRALDAQDLDGLHLIRTQPEVMANNPQGRVDRDLEETRPKLNIFLPPKDESHYNFAICLKETGDMIGIGGCHQLKSMFGWPAMGYMFRKEFWGKGLATEFTRAWLDMWCKLARAEVEIEVDQRSIPEEEGKDLEILTAFTSIRFRFFSSSSLRPPPVGSPSLPADDGCVTLRKTLPARRCSKNPASNSF